jgi:hypothetical protein
MASRNMPRTSPFLLLVLTALTGCSPPTCEVHGQVTLDGVAVPDAQIHFVPADEKLGPAFVRAGEDGRYRISLLKGDYTVRIQALKSVPAPAGEVGYNGRPPKTITVDVLPRKYHADSDLRTTVTGAAELDFKLTSESP